MNAPDRALRVNPDWTKLPLFERKGWRRMRFGDFADSINERVEPADAADEPYVGLEDLDPGDLHIRRWGKGSDVIGTKLRFRKGDIIFGRRRAYQRKLAVAEFDGICSAHAMVVRARPELVLPEFLPFLMMSDRFMKRAVAISVGSLSPTINWTTLKLEEFDLPPLKHQRQFAEVLAAIDKLLQAQISQQNNCLRWRGAEIEDRLARFAGMQLKRLDELWTQSPEGGCSMAPASHETGHHVLSLAALSEHGYRRGFLKFVEPTKPMLDAVVKCGDLLISRSNTQELVGLVGIFDEERSDVSFPDTMMRLSFDERAIDKHYIELVLLSRLGRRHMMRSAAGTSGSMKKINRTTLGSCRVPLPSLRDQRALVSRVGRIQEVSDRTCAVIAHTRCVQQQIGNLLAL
jgi:type I restriction enzyme, S subunit